MPGSARSTGSSRPTAMASSAEPCSDEAIGSSVNSRCSQAPAMVASARRLVVTFSMPSLTTAAPPRRRRWPASIASPSPAMRSRTTSGCSSRNSVATIRWVVTNSPSGHSSASSTSTWPPPSSTRRVAHGSGTQAPSMSPDWNAASVSAFSCGVIAHVAAAAGVGREALLGEPGPQGDVLGVAERRRGQRRAGEVGRVRRCPRGRRARRRPTSCRRRCAAPRRRTWRSR